MNSNDACPRRPALKPLSLHSPPSGPGVFRELSPHLLSGHQRSEQQYLYIEALLWEF